MRVCRRAGGPWAPAAHRPVSAQFSWTGLQRRRPGRAVTKGRTADAPTTATLELSCTAPESKRRGDEGTGGHRAPAGRGWHTSIGRTSDRWESSTERPSSARAGDTRFRPLGPGPVDRRSSPRSSNPPASRRPTPSRPRGFRFGDAVVEVRHAVLATRHTETIARGGGRAQASGRGLTRGNAGCRPAPQSKAFQRQPPCKSGASAARPTFPAGQAQAASGKPLSIRRGFLPDDDSLVLTLSLVVLAAATVAPHVWNVLRSRSPRAPSTRRTRWRSDAREDRRRMCPLEGHSGRSPFAIASIVWFESLSSRLFVTQ